MKRKTTQDVVLDYIRMYAQKGELTESLMDIADNLGYSNATIHRSLKALEEADIITIVPADSPRKPNTIIYKGSTKETHDILLEGEVLLRRLRELTEDIEAYIQESSRIIEYTQKDRQLKETIEI